METLGINLGRCYNKYTIIDILFYSVKIDTKDAQTDAESLFWVCSRRHRAFLIKNFSWYPSNIEWKGIWGKLYKRAY